MTPKPFIVAMRYQWCYFPLMKILSILTLSFILSTAAHAQGNSFTQLFKSTFYSENVYESSRCTQNVLRYLDMAKKMGLNVNQIEVIEMVNEGFDNFGLVGAKNARGSSERDHERNWYHHVFMKLGQTILDFDYTMKPTPIEIKAYFDSMYLTDKLRANKERCMKDVGSYKIKIYSGTDYLRYYNDKVPSEMINTKSLKLRDSGLVCL
jgi:hypothetical protein